MLLVFSQAKSLMQAGGSVRSVLVSIRGSAAVCSAAAERFSAPVWMKGSRRCKDAVLPAECKYRRGCGASSPEAALPAGCFSIWMEKANANLERHPAHAHFALHAPSYLSRAGMLPAQMFPIPLLASDWGCYVALSLPRALWLWFSR